MSLVLRDVRPKGTSSVLVNAQCRLIFKIISLVPNVRKKWIALLSQLRQDPYRGSREGVVIDETSGSVITITADVQLRRSAQRGLAGGSTDTGNYTPRVLSINLELHIRYKRKELS